MQFAQSGSTTTTRRGGSTTLIRPSSTRRRRRARQHENVGNADRIASVVGGSLLILNALRSRTFTGLIGGLLGAGLIRRGATGHCPLYEQLGVDTSGRPENKAEKFFHRGIHVEEAVTIQRPREEIFQFWRNFENLPRFMDHLKTVEVIDDKTSRWVAKAPIGYSVEWNAEIINEEPGTLIAWRSLLGADVDNRGAVHFRDAPQGRGTEVKVTLEYIPPAGRLGAAVAGFFGESPEWQIRDDLRRLRQILETGEIPTTSGQPSGRASHRRDLVDEQHGRSRPAAISDELQSGIHRSDPGDHLSGGLEHTDIDEDALTKQADSAEVRSAAASPSKTGLTPKTITPGEAESRRPPEALT